MRYRVAYEHAEDGSGEVSRWLGQAMTEQAASEAAASMRAGGDYASVVVERQDRPGGRWMACEVDPADR